MKQEIRKKRTDYVNRQYLGKLENRQRNCRSNSLGLIDGDVSLIFKFTSPWAIYTDTYRSKPEISADGTKINQMGFEIELVLADSLYGESESKFWDVWKN